MICTVALTTVLATISSPSTAFNIAVDASATPLGALPHFWYSGGYCPQCSRSVPIPPTTDGPGAHACHSHTAAPGLTDYSLGEDMHQNFIHVGAIPNRGEDRWQIRIHFLFDLVTIADQTTTGAYNFTQMDVLMERLVANRLKPGFELMGSPEFLNGTAVFTSFDDGAQVAAWRSLVAQTAQRYIAKFGVDEVRTWNWETWNEIENGDWDQTTFTPVGFRNYYDACAAGLADADPRLRFGGPGNCKFKQHDPKHPTPMYCFPLLSHMQNGTSFFGGPVRKADFMAQHAKGGPAPIDQIHTILQKEYELLHALHSSFPQFFTSESKMTFVNDEADPEEGWNKPRDWRADTRYGALMAKNVILHLSEWINSANSSALTKGLAYGLLSFDNAFLNYNLNSSSVNIFDQRTMVARFQMNESKPYRAETIRKQSINAHALMGLLGDQQLPLTATATALRGAHGNPLPWAPASAETMAIASSMYGEQLTVLVTTGNATAAAANSSVTLNLHITNLLPAIAKHGAHAAIFILGGAPGASDLWAAAGSPNYPSATLLRQMRAAQEVAPVEIKTIATASEDWSVSIDIPATKGGIALVHLCPNDGKPVPPPTMVASHAVSSNSTLISWRHAAHSCIRTFVVQDAETGTRLNVEDQIFMSFQLEGVVPRKLSVRAVNYAGASSAPAVMLV